MNTPVWNSTFRKCLIALTVGLVLAGTAQAQQHGGRGGHGAAAAGNGFHGGAGRGGSAAFHGGSRGFPAAGAYRPGFNASMHYGYGRGYGHAPVRPYYNHYAWRGRPYYGHRPGYRGWYGGLALGAFVATLPLYYSTYWWGGVPYYYYDNTYYRWNDGADQYQVVAPPQGADTSSAPGQPMNTDLYAYPKNGQTAERQSTDRYECHRWAADQTGFDPTAGSAESTQQDAYMRAEQACLEGRGYSVQ